MLEECCGEGYIWSIPYGSLNYCFLTQGTSACSHMTAISQSCVLTVRTPAQVCSLNVGTVLHWRDPVLCLWALLWERTSEHIANSRMFFNVNVQNGNTTKEHYYPMDIFAYYIFIAQYAACCSPHCATYSAFLQKTHSLSVWILLHAVWNIAPRVALHFIRLHC